jgi:hypothetical protein
MRLILLAAALAALTAAACRSSDSESEEITILKATMIAFGDDPEVHVPPINADFECAINSGWAQPQGATPRPPVGGICRWDLMDQGGAWYVSFKEAWACDEFSLDRPDFPPCNSETGTHTWNFIVDQNMKVTQIGDSGQFSPDMVHY